MNVESHLEEVDRYLQMTPDLEIGIEHIFDPNTQWRYFGILETLVDHGHQLREDARRVQAGEIPFEAWHARVIDQLRRFQNLEEIVRVYVDRANGIRV